MSWGQLPLSTSGVLSPFVQPPHLPMPKRVNQMECSLDSVHTNGQCLLSKTCSKMEHLPIRDSQGGLLCLSSTLDLLPVPGFYPAPARLTLLPCPASLSHASTVGQCQDCSPEVSVQPGSEGVHSRQQGRTFDSAQSRRSVRGPSNNFQLQF